MCAKRRIDGMTPREFIEAINAGAYAWPGSYPKFFATLSGDCLCFRCAAENRRLIAKNLRGRLPYSDHGWVVEAVYVNWENELWCAECQKPIECAYPTEEPNV